MKKQNLVWLPFIGILFTKENPLIWSFEKWLIYQICCTVLIVAADLIFLINAFLK